MEIADELAPEHPQSAADQDRKDSAIAQTLYLRDGRRAQKRLRLPHRQPVPDAHAFRFHFLHSIDAGRHLGWQESVIGRLARELCGWRTF